MKNEKKESIRRKMANNRNGNVGSGFHRYGNRRIFFIRKEDDLGYFQFGLVQGQMDYRVEKIGDIERLEFTWAGQDENDKALGRGWAVIKNDHIEGRFYFHLGDNSWFKAKKYN
jgi:hypothetical protein